MGHRRRNARPLAGLAFALSLASCSPVDLDAVVWRCSDQSDCSGGLVCQDRFCLPAGGDDGVNAGAIRVGLIAPLASPAGADLRAGLEAAFADVNAAGGLRGRSLILTVEDDGFEAEQARAAAEGFAEARSVVAVVGGIGHLAPALVDPLSAAEIPYLSVGRGPAVRPAPAQDALFAPWPGYPVEARALVDHVGTLQPPVAPTDIALIGQADGDVIDAHGEALRDALATATGATPPVFLQPRGIARVDTAIGEAIEWLSAQRAVENTDVPVVLVLGAAPQANASFVAGLLEAFYGLRRGTIDPMVYNLEGGAINRLRRVAAPYFFAPSGLGQSALLADLVARGEVTTDSATRPFCDNLLMAHPLPVADPDARLTRDAESALGDAAISDLSFEGWVLGRVLIEALDAAGAAPSQARLIADLEALELDLGDGVQVGFGSDHVGIDAVSLSQTDRGCNRVPIARP